MPSSSSASSSSVLSSSTCPWTCELTNDAGYVVYSALGSFYIPMFVMLFFYWRIYRAAVRTTRAINQGFKTTKGNYEKFPSFSSIFIFHFLSFRACVRIFRVYLNIIYAYTKSFIYIWFVFYFCFILYTCIRRALANHILSEKKNYL